MSDEKPMVEGFEAPISLHYTFAAGHTISRFLRSMKEGKIVGQRSPKTGKVIVPPRGSCPETGTPTTEEVTLPETGTVITFTVIHIPIPNNPIKPPFIVANICLDESDQTFIHLVSDCNNDDVKIGTRVKAVWKDKSEWDYSMDNIQYFKPLDEAPVDIEKLKAERLKAVEKYRHA